MSDAHAPLARLRTDVGALGCRRDYEAQEHHHSAGWCDLRLCACCWLAHLFWVADRFRSDRSPQNKIDLVKEKEAASQYEEILNFIRGTVADGAPIIPISAQLKYNIEVSQHCTVDCLID